MILVCESCSASLQFDEKKAPSGKFTIRCPKCKSLVSVSVGVGNQNASENGAESKTAQQPLQPAAPYKPADAANNVAATTNAGDDVMRLFANLLNQKAASGFNDAAEADKSVLLCLTPEFREKTAQSLSENGWKPFIAESVGQALETLNEIKIGNVVLASNFALERRGAASLEDHFFNLTPAERRRIFLIYLDNRTQNAGSHEAFLRNLNLIVNAKDLTNLPQILRRERRDFDETYRNFKKALAKC